MFLAVLASGSSFSTKARADVKITIRYTDVEREVSPRNALHKVNRTREFVLTDDHKIKSSFNFGEGHSDSAVVEFGKTYFAKTFTGLDYVSRWSVENGAIVHVSSTQSFSQILKVTTNGVDTCAATIQYRLAVGRRLFEDKRMSNREDVKISDMRADDVACSIASINE